MIIRDSDQVEDLLHVEGEKTVSTPLCEKSHNGSEQESASHGGIAEHVRPDKRLCCMLALFLRLSLALSGNVADIRPGNGQKIIAGLGSYVLAVAFSCAMVLWICAYSKRTNSSPSWPSQ